MDQSWSSCRDQVEKLVRWHKKEEPRSKQKSRAVEVMDDHIRNMTEVVLLYGSISTNNEVQENARNKLAAKKAKAIQICEALKLGQVRKRDLMEEGCDEDGEVSGLPKKRVTHAPKNQFAKEVESVLGGLREKATEFRTGIEEKAERDRINSQQIDLKQKLDTLIDTTRNTNVTIERLMKVIIQSTLMQRNN